MKLGPFESDSEGGNTERTGKHDRLQRLGVRHFFFLKQTPSVLLSFCGRSASPHACIFFVNTERQSNGARDSCWSCSHNLFLTVYTVGCLSETFFHRFFGALEVSTPEVSTGCIDIFIFLRVVFLFDRLREELLLIFVVLVDDVTFTLITIILSCL